MEDYYRDDFDDMNDGIDSRQQPYIHPTCKPPYWKEMPDTDQPSAYREMQPPVYREVQPPAYRDMEPPSVRGYTVDQFGEVQEGYMPDERMGQIPSWQGDTGYSPVSYYRSFGYPEVFINEQENERDMRRLSQMYPDVARSIMEYVEDECDKMEYEGSIMFDEMPDRVMFLRLCDGIYNKLKDNFENVEEIEDKDELFAMNKQTRRRYPPRQNWLGDMIQVIMLQEMYRRRCRHRNCRRWY